MLTFQILPAIIDIIGLGISSLYILLYRRAKQISSISSVNYDSENRRILYQMIPIFSHHVRFSLYWMHLVSDLFERSHFSWRRNRDTIYQIIDIQNVKSSTFRTEDRWNFQILTLSIHFYIFYSSSWTMLMKAIDSNTGFDSFVTMHDSMTVRLFESISWGFHLPLSFIISSPARRRAIFDFFRRRYF